MNNSSTTIFQLITNIFLVGISIAVCVGAIISFVYPRGIEKSKTYNSFDELPNHKDRIEKTKPTDELFIRVN